MGRCYTIVRKEEFGERLAALMDEEAVTETELANEMYVTAQCVSKWRNGQSIPDVQNLVNLSDYFDTTIDYLLTGRVHEDVCPYELAS